MHSTDPKFHPLDHMMWSISNVHLLVTGRMHEVSALHIFQNYLCAQRKSANYCLYSDHTNNNFRNVQWNLVCVTPVEPCVCYSFVNSTTCYSMK